MTTERPLVITATTLRWLEMCQRRIWLDQHGNLSNKDELPLGTLIRMTSGIDHETTMHKATSQHIDTISVNSWTQGVQVTQDLMLKGERAIIGAYLEAKTEIKGFPRPITIRGKVDRLTFISKEADQSGNSIHPIYIPIEIKIYTRLTPADELQLDCYIWLLKQIQGIEPPFAEFWLGRDKFGQPQERIVHQYDEQRLMDNFQKFIQLFQSQSLEPVVRIKPHCRDCHWYSSCKKVAENNLDVAILSGLRQDTRLELEQAGIVSLHQITAMQPNELRQFKGIKSTADSLHTHARAWVSGKPVWYGTLPEICRSSGYFFDIETDPITKVVWSIGWAQEEKNVEISIVAPRQKPHEYYLSDGQRVHIVSSPDDAWRIFADSMDETASPIYHWTGFDASMMQKFAPEDVKLRLMSRLHDLHHSFNQAVKFPVNGSSLKTIGAFLNYKWSIYQDYNAAYLDYKSWLYRGSMKRLEKACTYQKDDVVALALVWKWLIANSA